MVDGEDRARDSFRRVRHVWLTVGAGHARGSLEWLGWRQDRGLVTDNIQDDSPEEEGGW